MGTMLVDPTGTPIRSSVTDDGNAKITLVRKDEIVRAQSFVKYADAYDPDVEMAEAARPKPAVPFDFSKTVDDEGRPYEVQATLFEVSRDGQGYKLHKYNNRDEVLTALREAETKWNEGWEEPLPIARMREAAHIEREGAIDRAAEEALRARLKEAGLREGGSYLPGNDSQSWAKTTYGDGYDAGAEYIPLMAGPWSKQLYQQQFLEMHAKAFEAINHNPAAKRIIHLTRDFLFGPGLNHSILNPGVDEVWSEFVERTGFYDELAESIYPDMSWAGELELNFYDNKPFKGGTDYRMVDPSTILDVITDPEDIQSVYYYHQQYATAMQQYVTGNIPTTKYIIRQIPAGDILHVKLNVSKYEKRGRSDLFSILGWVKRLKDLMNARVIKGQLEAAFVWDVEVKQGDLETQAASMKLPDPYKAGSTFVHNSGMKLTPLSGGMSGSGDNMPDIDALLSLIAMGGNIPKEFLGVTNRGGRSGQLLSGEPGTRFFARRQAFINNRIVVPVFDRVVKNAIDAGLINPDEFLRDARTVKRIGKKNDQATTRDDVAKEFEQNKDDAQALADDNAEKQAAIAQAQSASPELAAPKSGIKEAMRVRWVRVMEALRGIIREATGKKDAKAPLSAEQLARIEVIKKSGKYAKELAQFMFPALTEENRSAELKDLALSESMEWISKETAATRAAKALGIDEYEYHSERAQIDAEALTGVSIASVYGQDNKHAPETTMAQDVQARDAAMTPPPPTAQFTNVPVPEPVSGEKLVPAQQPGTKPNTGDAKRNGLGGQDPVHTDPKAPSHGMSAAARHPMTQEGKGATVAHDKRSRQSVGAMIRANVLREALAGMLDRDKGLADYVTERERKLVVVEGGGDDE